MLNPLAKPLMPCSARTARVLLRSGKAKVVQKTPFVIQLAHGSSGYKQEIVGGLDTGSKVVGCAATVNGHVVYQSEVELRNDISGKLESRASFRRTRRGNKTRYRPMRWNNRKASCRKGRIAPSVQSKIDSHIREVRFVESILPVSRWNFELAAFDIHKITNPDVSGTGYQEGALKDYYNVKQYVLHRDGYTCQSGHKGKHSAKLHVHHRIFRSNGGSNEPGNLTTLCETCHDALHAGSLVLPKAKRSKTKHATEMGIIKSQLAKGPVIHQATFGYETKFKREQVLKLPKSHANDAVAICMEVGHLVEPLATILIKKHVCKGDYKQTAGARSEKRMPTGKLFGLRKFDKVSTTRGIGFVKGKRSTGYFSIADLDGNVIHTSEKVANCKRITARSTTQVESHQVADLIAHRKAKELIMQAKKTTNAARSALSLPGMNAGVSRAS